MNRMKRIGVRLLALMMAAPTLVACSDFFNQESDHYIYADDHTLDNATDTMYSVLGIINKLQAIEDRTILLGEVRGDLVDINSNTASDLRDVATFNVGSENMYNSPRDYYAVINNCNFFLAHADTALKNNSDRYIFQKEYAAVKAYRAWTYMQLALNYGKVPFVTTPILTKDDADREYERKDIKGICEYMISDLAPYVNVATPDYGSIRGDNSKLFYFPIYILMGDMNLWLGNYKEAALCYYKYLTTRNGDNTITPLRPHCMMWGALDGLSTMDSWTTMTTSESMSTSELITMLPGDSIPSEGNYSQLRNLFNTNDDNENKESLNPSDTLRALSAAQRYCYVNASGVAFDIPENSMMQSNQKGDLRFSAAVSNSSFGMSGNIIIIGGTDKHYQSVAKYNSRNVHLYRIAMVYLRMAEALNRAGYPEIAYKFLESGVNNSVIESVISDYGYDEAKAEWIRQFNFPNTSYVLCTYSNYSANSISSDANTMGIHRRGCGYASNENGFYPLPTAATQEELQEKVEDLIMTEEALEFAFEGHRYYDLMRVALRRNDPSYLAGHVYGRRGAAKVDEMKALIQKDLTNPNNWYLDWNGQIGITVGE